MNLLTDITRYQQLCLFSLFNEVERSIVIISNVWTCESLLRVNGSNRANFNFTSSRTKIRFNNPGFPLHEHSINSSTSTQSSVSKHQWSYVISIQRKFNKCFKCKSGTEGGNRKSFIFF